MIKIAHITTVDISLRGLLLNQMRSLQVAGYEVVGISSPGPNVTALEAAGIRHIPVPISRNLTPFADLVSLWRLYRLIRCERFAVVHTHNPKPGLLGQLAARMARVPVVVNTLHGFYFHEHMHPWARKFYISMEKIAARCSDVILSQNAEDIRTGIAEGIFAPQQVKHLGNGIDLTQFAPNAITTEELRRLRREYAIPDNAKIVGFVGRLAARRKGFLDFLRAARRIVEVEPHARFLVVGDADHGKPDAVDPSVAREYGIWDHCHFLGHRDNTELPALYKLMDVLVLPSLFEGIPRVIMECAAMGIPAVASNVKGNREAVIDGRTGFLVPLGDVSALSNAVLRIVQDSELAKKMGKEARLLAVEQFDETRVFERVKAEYARLAARQPCAQ